MQAWQLMFDSVDTANDCIRIATGVLSTIAINPARMAAGLSPDMLATDLAEYLVRKGAPFVNLNQRAIKTINPCHGCRPFARHARHRAGRVPRTQGCALCQLKSNSKGYQNPSTPCAWPRASRPTCSPPTWPSTSCARMRSPSLPKLPAQRLCHVSSPPSWPSAWRARGHMPCVFSLHPSLVVTSSDFPVPHQALTYRQVPAIF